MKRKRNLRPERKMKPVFLVFNEGETEEAYVNFLRQQYRLPIKVIIYKTGLSISQKLIKNQIKLEQLDRRDVIATFLMYDLDKDTIIEKLDACKESVNISSSPCIELWFLLHHIAQFAEISTTACISALQKIPDWANYKKGAFSTKQKQNLWEKRMDACHRARGLQESKNPSSAVYRLIEAMEKAKA